MKKKPQPSTELTGEALAEWERITGELKKLGRLNTADRALMTVYCQTWAINQAAAKQAMHTPTASYCNTNKGQSTEYKIYKETAALLRGFLNDLGLSPVAREFDSTKKDAPKDLNF